MKKERSVDEGKIMSWQRNAEELTKEFWRFDGGKSKFRWIKKEELMKEKLIVDKRIFKSWWMKN